MRSVFVLATLGYRKYKATFHVHPRPCSPALPAAWVTLAFLVFFQVPSAFAVPMAEWGGPWLVTPGDNFTSIGDDNEAKRAFGKGAQADGEIKNVGFFFEPLPSQFAFAKAYGRSESSGCLVACGKVFADTSIDFDRAFRLEDSPSGQWAVLLVAMLDGQIQAGGTRNPRAIVNALVTIAALSDPATPLFSVGFNHNVTHDNLIIDDFGSKQGFLNDGTYLVHGRLSINTEVFEQRVFTSGFAVADFFNDDFNWGLITNAFANPRQTPVPEPATIVLLGIGALALGGAQWRRRKKAC